MKLLQTGLAMTLTCLANFVFAADIFWSSTVLSTSPIPESVPLRVAGQLQLNLPQRQAVSFPAPFAATLNNDHEVSLCFGQAADSGEMYLVVEGQRRWLSNPCELVSFDETARDNQKAVTLVFAPE